MDRCVSKANSAARRVSRATRPATSAVRRCQRLGPTSGAVALPRRRVVPLAPAKHRRNLEGVSAVPVSGTTIARRMDLRRSARSTTPEESAPRLTAHSHPVVPGMHAWARLPTPASRVASVTNAAPPRLTVATDTSAMPTRSSPMISFAFRFCDWATGNPGRVSCC